MKNNVNQMGKGLLIVSFALVSGVIFSNIIYKSQIKCSNKKINTASVEKKEYAPEIKIISAPLIIKENDTSIKEEEKNKSNVEKEEKDKSNVEKEEKKDSKQETLIEKSDKKIIINPIVYDGLTMEELTIKLNKNLNSTLAGKGDIFASYSLSIGVDPYLALAISLQETGCKWKCSSYVTNCNNVGGQKGSPVCNNSYKKFNTLDEGIKAFIDNLKNNYYDYGLNTPELMNKKYAESTEWAVKVNRYIEEIKSK